MSHSYSRYSDFNDEDFICDPFFQEWIMDPNADKENFWKDFLENFPEKKSAVERARAVLLNISFVEHMPGEDRVQRSLARHFSAIGKDIEGKVVNIELRVNRINTFLRIAAIFGGVVLAAFLAVLLFVNKNDNKLAVQTEYGKLKKVLLPDSSSIVLNAHSKIEYSKNWSKGKKREVWLEGEAYFDIRHLNQDTTQITSYEQFVVHTNDLDVEVLGTSFDIRQRRGKTEVVLQTGRIKVRFKDQNRSDIIMSPGELVTYDPAEKEVNRGTADPESYTAWKENKLLLNNPTVNEIVTYLEDNFGKKIILQDARQGERKIDGPILLNNLDDALFILTTVLNTKVVQRDSTLIIQPR